jgi:hypothetical protein
LAKRLTSVRYLSTTLRHAAREVASSMGDAPYDSMYKLSRLGKGSSVVT